MSDLAPFVAAVIRDHAVQELMEENKRLMEENNRLKQARRENLMVRITGTNGTPVYCEQSLTNGRQIVDEDLNQAWAVDSFECKDAIREKIFQGSLPDFEIWVGASLLTSPPHYPSGDLINPPYGEWWLSDLGLIFFSLVCQDKCKLQVLLKRNDDNGDGEDNYRFFGKKVILPLEIVKVLFGVNGEKVPGLQS